ncbi:MAG: hypothetical protein B0W54_19430 [Cellvibrio sp. 79]|nr:MAG: hypothetical protein B0W54_19430 [Cellvibrio sp. 79]
MVFFFCFKSAALTIKEDCLLDLQKIPYHLLANDAGGKDIFNRKGKIYFEDSLHYHQSRVSTITSEQECLDLIGEYLKVWRDGHLYIGPSSKQKYTTATRKEKLKRLAEIKFINPNVVYVGLPNFQNYNKEHLKKLLLDNRDQLLLTKNWIIDVRGNGGGSDSIYYPILPWIISNETIRVSASWLVTEDNKSAQKRICDNNDSADCDAKVQKILDSMKGVANGDFASQTKSTGVSFTPPSNHPKAEKVAVLIDNKCASSCEEFILLLKQSFNVKTLGQRTAGLLDYSNLRPYQLPSGKRELWYATSRSNRLPYFPIDSYGIAPDIYLPFDNAESDKFILVKRVANWIEGGSLSPKQ